MELGGNAPFIVFADAGIDDAVDGALLAKMRNVGEACTAANRFYVHRSIRQDFAARLGERMTSLRLGRGSETGVEVGPLIDGAARVRVGDLVRDAVERGATAIASKIPLPAEGHFFAPTVLDRVAPDARVVMEEIFGPVASVIAFDDEAEVVRAANQGGHGLAAYVFTRDIDRALRVGERLQVGMVGINRGTISDVAAPFGGRKHSGFGREGGAEGISEYLETKYLALPDPAAMTG
jgi:succinate-semialdehyde dehydrogenase/glutarate-semialdehyde dehydrogenase